jgi:tetratricopeptide (TPR) repeat protein
MKKRRRSGTRSTNSSAGIPDRAAVPIPSISKEINVRLSLLLCLILLTAGPALAVSVDTAKVNALIAQGDVCSEQTFNDLGALKNFQDAIALDPGNYEILWRLSRTYADIGLHLPTSTDAEKQEQLTMYEKAFDVANKAVEANPNGSMGYTRRAIANGRIALFKGVWESIDIVKQVKADCEKAIALDPNNAAAYYVLGRTHFKVCEKPKFVRWPLGLGWGNMEESLKNYDKSIELRSNFIMYRLDAARAYVDEDNNKKAKELLSVIPTLPKLNEDDDQFRKEAAELMEKIK